MYPTRIIQLAMQISHEEVRTYVAFGGGRVIGNRRVGRAGVPGGLREIFIQSSH